MNESCPWNSSPLEPAVSRRQPEVREVAERKETLVGQVVHGEDGCRTGAGVHPGVGARQPACQSWRMQDVRHPVVVQLARGRVRADPAQQREALQVVGPLRARAVLVRAAAAPVQVRRVDDVRAGRGCRHLPQAQRDAPGPKSGPSVQTVRGCSTDSMMAGRPGSSRRTSAPAPASAGGRRAGDVRKSAGLDQWEDFRGDVQQLRRRRRHARASSPVPRACRA
jgi:hypothetical protein